MFQRCLSARHVFILLFFSLILLFSIVFKSFEPFEYSLSNLSSRRSNEIYQFPNNTEDEQTSLDEYSIWCLHMAHRLDSESSLPISPILQPPSIHSGKLRRLPYRYSQWKSSSRLPRLMTPCEHSLAMRLLMIMERLCRRHNILLMLTEGTLLGSWRHHDIIPWDDDIDVMIPLVDRERFLQLISRMNGTVIKHNTLANPKRKKEYYKISFKHTRSAGSYSWYFPFVDIFLYEQNQTHLWHMGEPEDSSIDLQYVFPLVMRPLGELWLPAPRSPENIFSFDPYENCKGHYWDHRNEKGRPVITVKCDDLKNIYPFVHRDNQTNSTEILRTNDTLIHTILYN